MATSDASLSVKKAAISALSKLDVARADLVEALGKTGHADQRIALTVAHDVIDPLSTLHFREPVTKIVDSSPDEPIVALAVDALLAHLPRGDTNASAMKSLRARIAPWRESGHPALRRNVARAFARAANDLGDPDAIAAVEGMATHSDAHLRALAADFVSRRASADGFAIERIEAFFEVCAAR